MTDFVERLAKVARNPEVFKQFGRGVERETLRYRQDGQLAETPHPQSLGSAFTNKWVTTDFSESLLEFITPVSYRIDDLVSQLEDIHHFAQSKLGDEQMWPLSMPCYVKDEQQINLAQYGTSNAGRMKTLYREGLKRRYGSLMQIISGVHFNFSFPESFWDALYGEQSDSERQKSKSAAYFGLIRNYYRFGWLIPYFFGASPAICPSFLRGRESHYPFEKIGQSLYLPHATSLRLSDLGYTNNAQNELKISFNGIDEYLDGLEKAIHTPSAEFSKIGVKVAGEYRQLNDNVLQIENELYAPIRPKRVARSGEKPSEALKRGGVEYIEVRSLDVNPYSPVGITDEQVRFLDLLLTWAMLSDSEPMNDCELGCWKDNWRKVVIEGRKPGLMLQIGCHGEQLSLQEWAHRVFNDLRIIAEQMDSSLGGDAYQKVCEKLQGWIDDPSQTVSAQFLELIRSEGGQCLAGRTLGQAYRQRNLAHDYKFYTQQQMEQEVIRSRQEQQEIEQTDTISFDEYLQRYFDYLHQTS